MSPRGRAQSKIGGVITLPPGWPWLKLRCEPRPGCSQMLPKRIWRARNNLYYGLRDYAGVRGDPRFEKIVPTVLNFSGNSRLPSSSV
jgi:hypothetical protein